MADETSTKQALDLGTEKLQTVQSSMSCGKCLWSWPFGCQVI